MLNYIWAGLIISSLVFAIGSDVGDIGADRYRNDQPLPVELYFPDGYDRAARQVPVEIRIDAGEYARFYDTEVRPAESYSGYLLQTREGIQLRFDAGSTLPEPLATISRVSQSRDGELQGRLVRFDPPAPAPAPETAPDSETAPDPETVPAPDTAPEAAAVEFEPVRFVKLNAISAAALDFAGTAAEIALGLIGVLALFLGLLKIAEEAGVIFGLVKLVRPILRPLFPEIPARTIRRWA
jgi:spore maturation protein A